MIYLPISPWSWVPLALAASLSAVACLFTLATQATAASPRVVYRRFFEGPGLTNSGTVSAFLSMLPILLSPDVREDVASASLLGTATLLFSVTTFLGLWLYSTVAARKVRRGDTLALAGNHLIAIQSVIITCMIVAVGCFIAFILVTPLLAPKHGTPPVPKAVFLKCSATGCTIDARHKGP